MRRLTLVAVVAGCAPMESPSQEQLAEVTAPEGAEWSRAVLVRDEEASKGGGTHWPSSPKTYEWGAVHLWIHGGDEVRPIVVEGFFGERPRFRSSPEIRSLRSRPFRLEAAEDGSILALSERHGEWMIVEPRSLLFCSHETYGGVEAPWLEMPSARDLALDVLAFAAGGRGPLGIVHHHEPGVRGSYTPYRGHDISAVSELWGAGEWARLHPEDERLQQAVLDALARSPEPPRGAGSTRHSLERALARAVADHPTVRARARALIESDDATDEAIAHAVVALAPSLEPAEQDFLGAWLLVRLEPGNSVGLAETAAIWGLASSAQRTEDVFAKAEHAAVALAARRADGPSHIRAARSYAAQLLTFSGSEQARSVLREMAAETTNEGPLPPWPPTISDFLRDAKITSDGRVGVLAGEFYPHIWARAGLAALGERQ